MLKAIILVFLVNACINGLAQEPAGTASPSSSMYLKKAKGQNTAAWVLAGAGTAFISAGAAIGFGEAMNSLASIFSSEPETYSNTGDLLFYTGLVMAAGSVPFFIAAGKNKRKAAAMSASFKLEERWQSSGLTLDRKYYPALRLRISLN